MAKTDLTIEREFYKTILHDCNVIFDVGCRDDNVFYELRPNAQIHLFDPNEVNIEEEIHGVFNVHFNNYALGNYKGETEFHYNYGSIIHRTEEPKFEGIHQSRIVPIDTIKNYCKSHNIFQIDFLKIDTEGYDFEVIKGCGNDILQRIRYIQFESWDEGYYGGIHEKFIFNYFKDWNIYKMLGTRPMNYIVTKEDLEIELLEQIQWKNI